MYALRKSNTPCAVAIFAPHLVTYRRLIYFCAEVATYLAGVGYAAPPRMWPSSSTGQSALLEKGWLRVQVPPGFRGIPALVAGFSLGYD